MIALAVMALAFWYHKSDNKIKVNKIVAEVIEMEEIDVTRQDDTPPPLRSRRRFRSLPTC